ncbi:phage baseplate assembly protein V [Photorhabdus luminescens]|uniref:Phage baseplate assembly protein V n=2 Tax=Morganellaceae TaxID=1903414 RepID=A0A1G5RID0_PHOLU|nr:phage baseplate assembly protein V [Photorhabdus luminescens]
MLLHFPFSRNLFCLSYNSSLMLATTFAGILSYINPQPANGIFPNMDTQLTELLRLLRNLIRTGVVTEVDTTRGVCRIATGNLETDWRPWLTMRAGNSRTWWAPSRGEQVLLLSVGGELTTSFVLPAVYSNQFPEPLAVSGKTVDTAFADQFPSALPASAEAVHIVFPDGAVMEYEPAFSALKVTGIKTAVVQASNSVAIEATNISLKALNSIKLEAINSIELTSVNKIDMKTLQVGINALAVKADVAKGFTLETPEFAVKGKTKLEGDVENTGGKLSSNGVTLHSHKHTGVMSGGATTGDPV